MSAIPTFNVQAVLPTLDEARRLAIEEIKQAKREGALVVDALRLLMLAMAQRHRPANTCYFMLKAMESSCRALFTCLRGLPLNPD
jgi:hypothetical protein